MRVLALQSGTSADGIDVAVVDAALDASTVTLAPVLLETVEWDAALRRDVLGAAHGDAVTAAAWTALDTRIGQAFGAAAAGAIRRLGRVDLVVSHGQTVFHWTDAGRTLGTLQLGEPTWIAEAADAPVVSHVRSADVAAGGSGAPLMAVFDRLWLGGGEAARATVNLGGIANVQVVGTGVVAFDAGPANCLVDAVVERATGAAFDRDGALAREGRIVPALLEAWLAHPYFAAAPPKTTGRDVFDVRFVDAGLAAVGGLALADVVATLTALTAESVVRALESVPERPAAVLVSGGGARNPELMRMLGERAARMGAVVGSSAEAGIDPEHKESLLFALLGVLAWHRVPVRIGEAPARIHGCFTPGPDGLPLPPPAAIPVTSVRVAAALPDEQ